MHFNNNSIIIYLFIHSYFDLFFFNFHGGDARIKCTEHGSVEQIIEK